MKKKSLALLIGIALILVAVGVVFASPGNKYGKAVTPPFPQPAEKDLQKIIFIRYAPGFPRVKPAKPACGDGIAHPSEQCGEPGLPECPVGSVCINCKCVVEEEVEPTACYGFLAGSKPRWNWVEDYYYENGLGTSSSWATATWDAATSATIFGSGILEALEWGVYDYKNSVSVGNYPETGVIAVAAIWFRGKNIYEYDIMFDTDYFPGGIEVDYDLETVTLHEFGHGAGLNDLYDVACKDEVMYGYLGVGEVRDSLGPGDTIGIQTLYGK